MLKRVIPGARIAALLTASALAAVSTAQAGCDTASLRRVFCLQSSGQDSILPAGFIETASADDPVLFMGPDTGTQETASAMAGNGMLMTAGPAPTQSLITDLLDTITDIIPIPTGPVTDLLDSGEDEEAILNGIATYAEQNRALIERNNLGVAMAVAMDTPQIGQDDTWGVSGGIGYFADQTAFAFSGAYRVNQAWALSAGVASGLESQDEIAARAGFNASW